MYEARVTTRGDGSDTRRYNRFEMISHDIPTVEILIKAQNDLGFNVEAYGAPMSVTTTQRKSHEKNIFITMWCSYASAE